MIPQQTQEQILARPDAALLAGLANEQRLSCSKCGSVAVSASSAMARTGVGTCARCQQQVPLKTATYYPNQQTTDPAQAVARWRAAQAIADQPAVAEPTVEEPTLHAPPLPTPLPTPAPPVAPRAVRTPQQLELFRASHIMQLQQLEVALRALPEEESPERATLIRRWERCQGVLDADCWARAQVELSGGVLPFTAFKDPEAAASWAADVLALHGQPVPDVFPPKPQP